MNSVVLNKVIHEQARLKILVVLASDPARCLPFTGIKTRLNMSAGNLSIQLKTLEEAGYITVKKYINGKKPKTDVSITSQGIDSLQEYINSLELLFGKLKDEGGGS